MNPSGSNRLPFGLSHQRMIPTNRFHPYTTASENSHALAAGQAFGGRITQNSSASPYGLPAPAASLLNGTLQRFNMPGRNATINYQNPHIGPALPRSATPQTYSRPSANAVGNNQNPSLSRAAPTPMGMSRPSYVGISQDRAFPSQQWQHLPSPSQMMPCAGGDAFTPVSQVASPKQQGKTMVKGNPMRSQGLRVLSGRVGKVSLSFLQLEITIPQ